MRYVQCYRCEAIQCRKRNIRPTSNGIRIAGAYVNPGLLRRVSLTTYRKCGGGFAKTVRRGRTSCRTQPPSFPLKPPSLEGGAARRRWGVRPPVQTIVSDI
ncbi:MAG: hypothetical protein LBM98_06100 [Oscillospiraceae bacterium]|nr:hypothetical protein [Oscillospiraceae bacterium]